MKLKHAIARANWLLLVSLLQICTRHSLPPQCMQAVMRAAYEQSRQHPNQRAEVALVIQSGGKKRVRQFHLWHKIFPNRILLRIPTIIIGSSLHRYPNQNGWSLLGIFHGGLRVEV